jgi:hypothetical protein
MSSLKYFSFTCGDAPFQDQVEPRDAVRPIVRLDSDIAENAFFCQADWLMKPFAQSGLYKNESDKLMVFIGSDAADHENLNAEIELWIENDKLTLRETCAVFVPGGAAHGRMTVKNLTRPVIFYSCLMNAGHCAETPAEAAAPVGAYADNIVEKYAPVDGFLPPAPEGFLTRLLWIDGAKLKGAPYMEAVWFHTANDTGPEGHFHDFDEIIGFLGSDPEHPEELNGDLTILLDGETIAFSKSCVLYIPRGVMHSPILVPKLDRSIIHFSGGNGGDYARRDGEHEDIFRA